MKFRIRKPLIRILYLPHLVVERMISDNLESRHLLYNSGGAEPDKQFI